MEEKVKKVKHKLTKVKKRYYVLGVLAAVIVFLGIHTAIIFWPYMNIKPVEEKQLDDKGLQDCKKLMVVAHPDDEFIWGGAHLLNDDYFVVCITRGNDEIRKKEFYNMLKKTGDKGLILSYPDKIGVRRSNWTLWKDDIEKDIETVLNYKDWEEVVTHNKDGEYGHQHHIMTHEIVEDAFKETDCKGDFYNFGKYYTVETVPNELPRIEEEDYRKKRELVFEYKSQMKTMRKLYHMLPHENWEKVK